MDHATRRAHDFQHIASFFDADATLSAPNALVLDGDSLEFLRRMPDHSVSLVLTDPPYHATKKEKIYGDTSFEKDEHYLEWMGEYAVEWRRVLRPNGSLFCFCDSSLSARLDVLLSKNFNMLAHVVWTKPNDPGFDGWKGKMKKEALRQWYPHSERILFAEPAVEGNLFRSPLGHLLYRARKQSGLSMHELTAKTGAHGKVNHGGAVSNWEAGRNTPSREQYEKIRDALLETGMIETLPEYEDAVRPFNMDASKQFTDVWDFPSVRPYADKHPAEKPLGLLMHAIEATTYPGDIVLDCFAGSGNTALSAVRLGRRAIAMEIDRRWVKNISMRVAEQLEAEPSIKSHSHKGQPVLRTSKNHYPDQLALFVGGR